ncbi:unnamed protein product [Lactuca saligna]|uniref:Replication factor A C-terminal domain-containing protein n=1 Tax=Lactuca saligna TaxID=75948 RepID=A0AA35ZDH1_LACSI|nr:unnamed protein product [Lactuca saligna]
MRLVGDNTSFNSYFYVLTFASWLLKVGDGDLGHPDVTDTTDTKWIDIPSSLTIPSGEAVLQSLQNMSEIFITISELQYGSPGMKLQVRILRTWIPQQRTYETCDQEIAISLWRECTDVSEKFDRVAIETAIGPTVIVVTNVKITPVSGSLMLGTTSASYVYINPPIAETTTSLNSFTTNPTSLNAISAPPISLFDMKNKSHSDLLERTFSVTASIVDFKFTDTWYNVLCPLCRRPTLKQGNNWFCPSHGVANDPTYVYVTLL